MMSAMSRYEVWHQYNWAIYKMKQILPLLPPPVVEEQTLVHTDLSYFFFKDQMHFPISEYKYRLVLFLWYNLHLSGYKEIIHKDEKHTNQPKKNSFLLFSNFSVQPEWIKIFSSENIPKHITDSGDLVEDWDLVNF